MFWTIVILIVALVGTNLAWLIYESQFDNKLFSDIIIYRPKVSSFPYPFGRLEQFEVALLLWYNKLKES